MSVRRRSTHGKMRDLEGVLSTHFGTERHIVAWSRRSSPHRSSFALHDVDVTLEDGTVLALVIKNLRWHALSRDGRQAKSRAFYDSEREVAVYRDLLSAASIGTATYYGAVVDKARIPRALVLERVAGNALNVAGNFAAWEHTARWLARFHAAPLQRKATVIQMPLLHYDTAFYRWRLRRAERNLRLQDRADAERFQAIVRRYKAVITRLVTLPRVVIHGEFYPSNVLATLQGARWHICPVDWEMASWAPPLIDLAALTAGGWSDEARAALVAAYRDAWTDATGQSLDTSEFSTTLDCCRIQLAVQELGRSSRWTPPTEHAYDWLTDAVAIAARLR